MMRYRPPSRVPGTKRPSSANELLDALLAAAASITVSAEVASSGRFSLCIGGPTYFFNKASIAACAIASSTSDAAPLHAIAPIVSPSTWMGSPP